MTDKLFDALEICLREMENGASLDAVLARYPSLAGELRPILQTAMQARSLRGNSDPSPDAVRRGRAKVLQHAAELREAKRAPRRRVIPMFQRLALSIGMTATFLASGTGLVGASANALPGENLYPVKRTWEDIQLLFTLNQDARDAVKSQFEVERLNEVSELIAEGRHELIEFVGIFSQTNDGYFVSGVAILLPSGVTPPEDGTAVIVTGRTNAQGYVELETIGLMPEGVFVPLGAPLEIETHSGSGGSENNNSSEGEQNSNADSSNDDQQANSNETISGKSKSNENADLGSEPKHRQEFEVEGVVESITDGSLILQGRTINFNSKVVKGNLQAGVKVEIEGYFDDGGQFIVTKIKVKESGSSSGSGDSSDDHSSGDSDGGGGDNDSNVNGANDNSSNDNDDHGGNDNGGGNSNDND